MIKNILLDDDHMIVGEEFTTNKIIHSTQPRTACFRAMSGNHLHHILVWSDIVFFDTAQSSTSQLLRTGKFKMTGAA